MMLLMLAGTVGAQERGYALNDCQHDQLALMRRLATLQPPLQTFRYEGTTYFVEHIRNGLHNNYLQLVDLPGNEAPDVVKTAFITRCLGLSPDRMYYGGNYEGCDARPEIPMQIQGAYIPVPESRYIMSDEGISFHPTLHWVPLGISRSYREPAGIGKQNYVPFALGATAFTFRLDGGRLYLHGVAAAFALGGSNPDSQWSGVLQVSWVPVAIHVAKGWYIAPTLGTAEITGRTLLRWKGIKTVGVQVSACISGCEY